MSRWGDSEYSQESIDLYAEFLRRVEEAGLGAGIDLEANLPLNALLPRGVRRRVAMLPGDNRGAAGREPRVETW